MVPRNYFTIAFFFCLLQVIQIYKDPDGNPLRRGGKQSSGFSRGTPFTRSLEAIQNHAMIEEENKELRKQVEEVSFLVKSSSIECREQSRTALICFDSLHSVIGPFSIPLPCICFDLS